MNAKRTSLLRTNEREFPSRDVDLSELMKAFGHPARLAILRTLAARNECVCGEIVDVVPLAQSTVSQHLKQLREAGIIQGEVEGTASCYCINKEAVKRYRELVDAFLDDITK